MNRKRRSPIWRLSDDEFRSLVMECSTASAVLLRLGLKNKGGNYLTLKNRLVQSGVNTDHFIPGSAALKRIKHRSLDDILINGSVCNRSSLKSRLVKAGLLENKCSICGCGDTWNGKQLTLQLDHINGISNDNRLENLRLLCPNCHSQTATFAGAKNKKSESERHRVERHCLDCGIAIKGKESERCKSCALRKRQEGICKRPPVAVLFEMLEKGNLSSVGRDLGVSASAVKKWRNYYLVNR